MLCNWILNLVDIVSPEMTKIAQFVMPKMSKIMQNLLCKKCWKSRYFCERIWPEFYTCGRFLKNSMSSHPPGFIERHNNTGSYKNACVPKDALQQPLHLQKEVRMSGGLTPLSSLPWHLQWHDIGWRYWAYFDHMYNLLWW